MSNKKTLELSSTSSPGHQDTRMALRLVGLAAQGSPGGGQKSGPPREPMGTVHEDQKSKGHKEK